MSTNIPSGYRRLAGSERKPMPGARNVGPADSSEQISVTIVVRRRDAGEPQPHTGAKLSREEFSAKFGAAEEDMRLVEDFARSHGLEVVESHPSRRTVIVVGTVDAMSKAFGVQLHRFESPDKGSYRGREGFIHMPDDLADIVEGVFGLDNRKIGGRNTVAAPERVVPGANLRMPNHALSASTPATRPTRRCSPCRRSRSCTISQVTTRPARPSAFSKWAAGTSRRYPDLLHQAGAEQAHAHRHRHRWQQQQPRRPSRRRSGARHLRGRRGGARREHCSVLRARDATGLG